MAALLHTPLRPGQMLFPADVSSFGFDNQADALTITPTQAELYETAADLLIDDLFRIRDEVSERVQLPYNGPGVVPVNGEIGSGAYLFTTEGSLQANFVVPHDGTYQLRARAFGAHEGDDPVQLALEIDGVPHGTFDAADTPTLHQIEAWLPPGEITFSVRFVNPVLDPEAEQARRVLHVQLLELEGPLDPEQGLRTDYWRVVPCDPAEIGETACARHTLRPFAATAWRRPLTEADELLLDEVYGEARGVGLDWAGAVGHAMKLVLLSPDFLFRVETPAPAGAVVGLTDHELASRLSFFLWSGPPDAALLTAADRGELSDPAILAWHATRMLEDDRASALIDNFAEQWFGIRSLAAIAPDPELYEAFDEELRTSMAEELRRLARSHLLEDRSMIDLFTTQRTWLDARLAEHYGLPSPTGGWAEVDMGSGRSGLITTAGLLSLSSHPDRASVVRRGKVVLSSLLCDEPPPPPPGVEGLEDLDPASFSSVREQLEVHRADPSCASCHAEMDPIGLALQPFDAIGLSRTLDELGAPIDANTTLPDGTELRGPYGVTRWVAADPRLPRCMAEKTFTWGLGRVPTEADEAHIDAILERFVADDHRFESLVLALIDTTAFRMKASGEVP